MTLKAMGRSNPPRLVLPSTARSMMVGRVFLVLTGACQFGQGVGGFTANFIHSEIHHHHHHSITIIYYCGACVLELCSLSWAV